MLHKNEHVSVSPSSRQTNGTSLRDVGVQPLHVAAHERQLSLFNPVATIKHHVHDAAATSNDERLGTHVDMKGQTQKECILVFA